MKCFERLVLAHLKTCRPPTPAPLQFARAHVRRTPSPWRYTSPSPTWMTATPMWEYCSSIPVQHSTPSPRPNWSPPSATGYWTGVPQGCVLSSLLYSLLTSSGTPLSLATDCLPFSPLGSATGLCTPGPAGLGTAGLGTASSPQPSSCWTLHHRSILLSQ